jgi:hypothetical protein
MVLEDLSCRAWFCGDLGDGWAEEMLLLRPQISESFGRGV